MSHADLTFGIAALLLTPGPTNAALLITGAARGMVRGLPAVGVTLAAYLGVVVPLMVFHQQISHDFPLIRQLVTILAALWVLRLAWRIWVTSPTGNGRGLISLPQMAVTTILNPKAFIFGVILLPSAPTMAVGLSLFTVLAAASSLLWLFIGCCMPSQDDSQSIPPLFRRIAAGWLVILALWMVLMLMQHA